VVLDSDWRQTTFHSRDILFHGIYQIEVVAVSFFSEGWVEGYD